MDPLNSLPIDVAGPWSACLAAFARDLSAQQYATWIRPLRCEPTTAGLRVLAPNRFVLQWVKERFGARISAVGAQAAGAPVAVEYALADARRAPAGPCQGARARSGRPAGAAGRPCG